MGLRGAHYFFAKGQQGNFEQFEMLSCPGNTNDADEEQCPHDEVVERNGDAAHQNPDDIGEHDPAAACRGSGNYFFTEGPQHQSGQFKTLQSKRDSNNGEAEHQAARHITDGSDESAKHQPDKVS